MIETIEQLRAYVERMLAYFTPPIADYSATAQAARAIAANPLFANLAQVANKVQAPRVDRFGQPQPDMQAYADATIEAFAVALRQELAAYELRDAKTKANAGASRDEVRDAVLAYLAEREAKRPTEPFYSSDIQQYLSLTVAQVIPALGELRESGYLTAKDHGGGVPLWIGQLTSRGLRFAEGRLKEPNFSNNFIFQTIHGGGNAVGINTGTVSQTSSVTYPPMPAELRTLLEADPHGRNALESLEEELAKPEPAPKRLQTILESIKTLVTGANVVTTVAPHVPGWIATMEQLIAAHLR